MHQYSTLGWPEAAPKGGCLLGGSHFGAATDGEAPTLSKAHIRPDTSAGGVEYREGSNYIKTSKGVRCEAVGGGIRGQIKGFSKPSAKRMRDVINSVRLNAPLPVFVTLTYPDDFPSITRAKRDFSTYGKRFRREFPNGGIIWKKEFQQRGAAHFHMLVYGVSEAELRAWVPQAWYEIVGSNDIKHLLWHEGKLGHGNKPCVEQVRTLRGVRRYTSKYMTKEVEHIEGVGRYWGIVGGENIPFGERKYVELSFHEAAQWQRYQRRFTGMKCRGRSMTTYCDAEQWVTKLLGNHENTGKCAMGASPQSVGEGIADTLGSSHLTENS